jgi:hypothetical protein
MPIALPGSHGRDPTHSAAMSCTGSVAAALVFVASVMQAATMSAAVARRLRASACCHSTPLASCSVPPRHH